MGEGREGGEQLGHQTKRQLDGFACQSEKRGYSWVALCRARRKEETRKSELRETRRQGIETQSEWVGFGISGSDCSGTDG